MEGQYTRAQTALLLDISGSQFDYLVKQLDIKSVKIGREPIYTLKQVLKFKLALYLKSLKYPVEIIRLVNTNIDFDENIRLLEKHADDLWVKVPSFMIHIPNGMPNKEILKKLESIGKDRITKHESGHNIYLIINQEEVNSLKDEILKQVKSGSFVYIQPILSDSYNELKIVGKKHNISIPGAA